MTWYFFVYFFSIVEHEVIIEIYKKKNLLQERFNVFNRGYFTHNHLFEASDFL